MTDDLVRQIAQQLDRRSFLRKAAATSAGILLGLFGLAGPAAAFVSYKCCNLCYSPVGTCSGSCASNNMWCWGCYYAPEDRDYLCCEKFDNITNCNNKNWCDPHVLYSCYLRLGSAPERGGGGLPAGGSGPMGGGSAPAPNAA